MEGISWTADRDAGCSKQVACYKNVTLNELVGMQVMPVLRARPQGTRHEHGPVGVTI
jgi:hypothetical protein